MESLGEKMDRLAVDDEERTSIASYFCKLKEKKVNQKTSEHRKTILSSRIKINQNWCC